MELTPSYSQLWLGPYGWTSAYPPDYNEQMGLMSESVTALSSVFGTRYVYGPSYTTIYPSMRTFSHASCSSFGWQQRLDLRPARYCPLLRH